VGITTLNAEPAERAELSLVSFVLNGDRIGG